MISSNDHLIEVINLELFSNKDNHLKECRLCGNKDYFKTHNVDRFGININFGICNNCGLFQIIDDIGEDIYKNFYENYYPKIHKGVEKFDPKRIALQERRGEDAFKEVNQLIIKNNKEDINEFFFVDIGCSSGAFLSKFLKNNFYGIGYDIDGKAIEYGKKLYKTIDLRNKDFFKDFKRQQKTIFFLSHVLEHILDPHKFLIEMKKKMEIEDMIYIAVPQITSILIKKNKSYIKQFTEITHVTYFSKKTLKSLIIKSGFNIIKDLTNNGNFNSKDEPTYDLKIIIKPKESSKKNSHKITYCSDTMKTINLLKIKRLGNKFKIFKYYIFRRLLFALS